jgi:hypothetical protein
MQLLTGVATSQDNQFLPVCCGTISSGDANIAGVFLKRWVGFAGSLGAAQLVGWGNLVAGMIAAVAGRKTIQDREGFALAQRLVDRARGLGGTGLVGSGRLGCGP